MAKQKKKALDLRILALGAVILFTFLASGISPENLGASIPPTLSGPSGLAPAESAPTSSNSSSSATSSTTTTATPTGTGASALENAAAKGLPVAASPADCASRDVNINNEIIHRVPVNCIFLEEPIGGRVGYDLYVVNCGAKINGVTACIYALWFGGTVYPDERGPIQAVLTANPDRPYQGPFGLLYGYLSLVYGYMSGIIVGMAVLFVVIGGVQMTTSAGDTGRFDAGKSRIVKAIVGLILWFTASLILYTINPTFFAF